MNRLNFGCGSIQPADWTNVDRDDHGQQHIGSTELFHTDSFDLVVAHCVLQITPYDEIPTLLAQLYRIIAPGGSLQLSLPDIEAGFEAFAVGNLDWFPNSETDLDDRFSNWLTWYSTSRSLFTPVAIASRLREAGFDRVLRVATAELDTRGEECFFIEAIK